MLDQFDGHMKPKSSAQLLEIARRYAGNTLIAGVSGKDSLAAVAYVLENGFKVVPYWLYTVPLQVDIDAVEMYKSIFGFEKFYLLPHPLFYNWLNSYAFVDPLAAVVINEMNLPSFSFAEIEDEIAKENGLYPDYLSVIGYRASDNLGRRSFIARNGAIGTKKRKYYFSIWDWSKKQVFEYLREKSIPLPEHYKIWGNTGTGRPFEPAGLSAMQDKAPADLDKVRDFFKLIDVRTYRYSL